MRRLRFLPPFSAGPFSAPVMSAPSFRFKTLPTFCPGRSVVYRLFRVHFPALPLFFGQTRTQTEPKRTLKPAFRRSAEPETARRLYRPNHLRYFSGNRRKKNRPCSPEELRPVCDNRYRLAFLAAFCAFSFSFCALRSSFVPNQPISMNTMEIP